MPKKEDILTIEELSEYLKIPKSTVYKLCQEGKIPGQKVGRHWRFHKKTVEDWLSTKPSMHHGIHHDRQ